MNIAPMYNPITNTIGTTDRPTAPHKTTKIRIDPVYKNFIKFNTSWNFKKQHELKCCGHFEDMPHWDQTTASKRVCTVCGAIAQFTSRAFNPEQPTEHRPQVIKQANKLYEVVFTGYIPKKVMGISSIEDDIKPDFNSLCVCCQMGFNSDTPSDLCPSCKNNDTVEEHPIDYDKFYEDKVEVWQQGQNSEVGGRSGTNVYKKLQIQQWRINELLHQCETATNAHDKNKVLRHANELMKYNERIHVACLNEQKRIREAHDLTPFDTRTYERRARMAGKNAFELMHAGKEDQEPTPSVMLHECALSDVKQLPVDVEVIEVTRAKNHILSPSWQVLKQYKKNGDWMQYTAAFMAEMARPGPLAEMKKIIERAKHHPIYLACFEREGHCHRFLLLEWMNRLATC